MSFRENLWKSCKICRIFDLLKNQTNYMRRKFYKKHVKRINPALLAILFLEFVFSPHIALANQPPVSRPETPAITIDSDSAADNSAKAFNLEIRFPQAADRKVIRTYRVTATAYSSTRAQTDSTPFISASGVHVFDGMIAANFLPFGAKVRLPDLYGDKQFIVLDRMNQRYSHRVDIWMDSYHKAKQFGVKYIRVEVIE